MRLSRLFSFAALAFALTPLFACAGDEGDDHIVTPSEEGSEEDELRSLQLTEKDNGKTVTVKEGQNVMVKLKANPSTGFAWKVTSTDRSFGYPVEKFFPNGGAVGSGGIDRFTWKTKSPLSLAGSHTVKMEYKRPWEANVAAAQTFTFTVKILSGDCPQLSPPAPGFCQGGRVTPRYNENGCAAGYDCEQGCGACGAGRSCQYCWGHMACIPNGAMC